MDEELQKVDDRVTVAMVLLVAIALVMVFWAIIGAITSNNFNDRIKQLETQKENTK